MREYTTMETKVGLLYIVIEDGKLAAIHYGLEDFIANEKLDKVTENSNHPILQETVKQINEYFSGQRTKFELPLEQKGTEFQMDVWKELAEIPFGSTKNYLDIAIRVGRPKAVRAVGQANKANKLPIIIPCHRVIGKKQTLTGYAGTRTDIKEILLSHEGAKYKQS